MDTEEVVLKMGFDSKGVSEGAKKVSDIMGQTSNHVAEHFVHAESQGKAFKKVLHEIADTSPLLGNALRLALDPIAGLMFTLTAGIKMVHKAFEDVEKFNEKMAENAAKRRAATEESSAKAVEGIHKQKEAHEEFEDKLEKAKKEGESKTQYQEKVEQAKMEAGAETPQFAAKKAELDKARKEIESGDRTSALSPNKESQDKSRKAIESEAQYQEAIKQAKIAAGENTPEFFAKKKALDLEEKSRVEAESAAAAEKDRSLQQAQTDQGRLFTAEELKRKHKELVALEEKANKEAEQKQQAAEKTFHWTMGGVLADEKSAIAAKDKANSIRELRESVERTMLEQDAVDKKRAAEQKEAQSDMLKAPAELARINKEMEQDEARAREAKKKEDEKAKKDAIETTQINRELGVLQRKRREAETAEFMPTLKELADSATWMQRAEFARKQPEFERQKAFDEATMRRGLAYGQRFAGEALEEGQLKEEMKRALFIEGPDSDRFKKDAARLKTLKSDLAAAGLQTADDKLESIDNSIAKLLERAEKDGLIVQPVNGA